MAEPWWKIATPCASLMRKSLKVYGRSGRPWRWKYPFALPSLPSPSSPVIKILRVAQDDRGGRRLRMTPMRKAHAEQSVTCHAEVSVACHSEQSWVCHAERSEASLGVTCKSMCTHRWYRLTIRVHITKPVTVAGIYDLRRLQIKRCGRPLSRAVRSAWSVARLSPGMSTWNFFREIYHPRCPGDHKIG